VDVKNGVIYLTPDEVDEIACPANPKWARSQILAYGLARCARSEKLRPLLACTELLKSLGLDFVVMEAEAESEVDDSAAALIPVDSSPEVGLAPSEVMPARGVVPEGLCNCPPVG